MAVIGLDLSMTSTGLARVNNQGKAYHNAYTWTVKSKGNRGDTLEDRALRIADMKDRIVQDIGLFDGLAVIESPSYGSAGSGTWDRAGLWWQVVSWLFNHQIPVAMVAPTTLKKWATGDGRPGRDNSLTKAQQAKASKEAVRTAVQALFPDVQLLTYDEADALAMAHLGAVYREFVDIPLAAHHTPEAMAAVKWPETLED